MNSYTPPPPSTNSIASAPPPGRINRLLSSQLTRIRSTDDPGDYLTGITDRALRRTIPAFAVIVGEDFSGLNGSKLLRARAEAFSKVPGIVLWGCNLAYAQIDSLRSANLALYACNLTKAEFHNCQLPGLIVEHCTWTGSPPKTWSHQARREALLATEERPVWYADTAPLFADCDLFMMQFQPVYHSGQTATPGGQIDHYKGPELGQYARFTRCDLSGAEIDFLQSGNNAGDWTRFYGSYRVSTENTRYMATMHGAMRPEPVASMNDDRAFALDAQSPGYARMTQDFIDADRLLAKYASQAARYSTNKSESYFDRPIIRARRAVTSAMRNDDFSGFERIVADKRVLDQLRKRAPLSKYPCVTSHYLFGLVLASEATYAKSLLDRRLSEVERGRIRSDLGQMAIIYNVLTGSDYYRSGRIADYAPGDFGKLRKRFYSSRDVPVTSDELAKRCDVIVSRVMLTKVGPKAVVSPETAKNLPPPCHVVDMAGTADEDIRAGRGTAEHAEARARIDALLQDITAEAAGRPIEVRNWKISAPGPFDLSNIRFVGCTFTKLDLQLCNMSGAVFVDCTFVLCRYLRASPRVVRKWLPHYDAYPWLADLVVRRKNALPDVLDELQEQMRLQHKGKFPPWPTKPKMINCDMGSTVVESTTLDDFKGSFDFKTSVLPTAYRSRDAATRQVRTDANGKWLLPKAGAVVMHTSKAMQGDAR